MRTASLLAGHNWRSISTALAAAVPVLLVSLFIATEPHPWHGKLASTRYPGAAMLAGKIIKLKPAPVLPPPAALQLPEYWQQGCLAPIVSSTPTECDYGDLSHPALTVALVGDSMAGNWFTPLQAIAVKRHWRLVTDLHAECPLSSAMLITPKTGGPYTPCHDWGKAVMHDLVTRIKPDVVITSEYPIVATVRHPVAGPDSEADIGKGMAKYWQQLERHGIPVVAIKETPLPGRNMLECVSRNLADPSICDVPRSMAIRRHLPTVYAARATRGKVPIIDMNPLICGPLDCAAVVGNVLVYQDSHHLTSAYTLTMAPYLERRLLRVSKTLAKRH